jgi:hypothetical protein
MKGINVSNPLSLIAIFASLAESIALGILPFSEHLTSAQIWAIILFAVLYPFLMAGVFWWVLIYRHANLFSPEEHGRDRYSRNVLSYRDDQETNNFLNIWAQADESGRSEALNAKIRSFLEPYGIEEDAISFMLNPSNDDLHEEVMKYLNQEWIR